MRAIDKAGSAFHRAILRRMKELGVSQTELARALQMDFLPMLTPRAEGVAYQGEPV